MNLRSDLLYSQAAIDWAVSNFISFEQRLNDWINVNIKIGVEILGDETPNNLLIAGCDREGFPLSLSVEAGAYINAIRSSLDMLATALAYRHGLANPDKAAFPITKSAMEFGLNQSKTFLDGLPVKERKIIESLKPYGGGNEVLCALHTLDNMRKHRRLLMVFITPEHLKIRGLPKKHFIPVATGYVDAGDRIILGLLSKEAAEPRVELHAQITINEEGIVNRKAVMDVLKKFAYLATSIIEQFNYEPSVP